MVIEGRLSAFVLVLFHAASMSILVIYNTNNSFTVKGRYSRCVAILMVGLLFGLVLSLVIVSCGTGKQG